MMSDVGVGVFLSGGLDSKGGWSRHARRSSCVSDVLGQLRQIDAEQAHRRGQTVLRRLLEQELERIDIKSP